MRKIILLAAVLATSCSTTIDFQGATNFYNTPEVAGETMGVTAQLEYGNSTKFVLGELEQATIFSSQINVSTDSGMHKENVLTAQAALGLGEQFEVYYRALADSADPIGVKFQFIGSGANKKEKGFKAMVMAGYAPTSEEDDKFKATNGQGTSREYDTHFETGMNEVALSLGYRFDPKVIAYIIPYYRSFSANAILTSTSYPRVEIDKKALIRGANLGLRFDAVEKVFIMIEGGYAHSQYTSSFRRDDYALGGAMGITTF